MRRGVFYVICMFCLTCLLLKVVFNTITLTHVYPKGQLGGRHGRDLQLPMQSVLITTEVVSTNPTQTRYTRYNIM